MNATFFNDYIGATPKAVLCGDANNPTALWCRSRNDGASTVLLSVYILDDSDRDDNGEFVVTGKLNKAVVKDKSFAAGAEILEKVWIPVTSGSFLVASANAGGATMHIYISGIA